MVGVAQMAEIAPARSRRPPPNLGNDDTAVPLTSTLVHHTRLDQDIAPGRESGLMTEIPDEDIGKLALKNVGGIVSLGHPTLEETILAAGAWIGVVLRKDGTL